MHLSRARGLINPLNHTGESKWPWMGHIPDFPEHMPDGSPWPRISIVTPSMDQADFLERTIRSVLLQGYPNLEYFIIDGASHDRSIEIIERYQPYLAFWVSEPDQGQSQYINKGFSRATGIIYHWLNSDDSLLPGALQRVAHMHKAQPNAAAWVGVCNRIDSSGKLLSKVEPRNLTQAQIANWSRAGFFYQPACFFSAQAWTEVGQLDENLEVAMDLDLWMRLAAWGKFIKTDQLLAEAIIHPRAKTRNMRSVMHAETIYVQIRYGYQDVSVEYIKTLQDRFHPGKIITRFWKIMITGFLRFISPNPKE